MRVWTCPAASRGAPSCGHGRECASAGTGAGTRVQAGAGKQEPALHATLWSNNTRRRSHMGLIHSRAAKQNNKAQAKLATQEAKTIKADREGDAASRHVDAYFDGRLPKWRLTTGELLTVRRMEKARDAAETNGS